MAEIAKRTAAIYIGAYTLQMLIAEVVPGKDPETINEFTAYTHVADHPANVSACSEEGLALTEKALAEMHEIARQEGVTEYRLCASSTIRQLANRSMLLLIFRKEFGIFPQLLGTLDEARLHFLGASTHELDEIPLIVAYMGYNTTPVAYGKSSVIESAQNLPFGIGRLNHRFHVQSTSCGMFHQLAVRTYLKRHLFDFSREIADWKKRQKITPELILVGPFPTTYVSIEQKKRVIDVRNIAQLPHQFSKLTEITKKIASMKPDQRKELPYVDQGMSETLMACLMFQRAVVEACGMKDFRVSATGLCTGMLKIPAGDMAGVSE